MPQVEMIAISGFETALIGTGMRATDKEVLVYDGDIAQAILDRRLGTYKDIMDYLQELGIDELGDEAPIFIFTDKGLRDDIDDGIEQSTLH